MGRTLSLPPSPSMDTELTCVRGVGWREARVVIHGGLDRTRATTSLQALVLCKRVKQGLARRMQGSRGPQSDKRSFLYLNRRCHNQERQPDVQDQEGRKPRGLS